MIELQNISKDFDGLRQTLIHGTKLNEQQSLLHIESHRPKHQRAPP